MHTQTGAKPDTKTPIKTHPMGVPGDPRCDFGRGIFGASTAWILHFELQMIIMIIVYI
jgi:hypothetical protein